MLYQKRDHKTYYFMKTIKEIYRIGKGPSSSHTMGPRKAAEEFVKTHTYESLFEVILTASLAATGKSNLID